MKNESIKKDSRIVTFRFTDKDISELNKLCVNLTNAYKKPIDKTKAIKWAILTSNKDFDFLK